MKKLFVHHPLFRLLSPLFSGTLVYLLILLINNNIGQLKEAFLGLELYVCIGLAYLIQEYARLSLIWFARFEWPRSFLLKLPVQLVSSVVIGIGLVSLAMYLYFNNVLGYTPNTRELFIFNSIFSLITVIYLVLYLSHQFLYRVNTDRIAKEIEAKEEVEADFLRFRSEVNPNLLFESLESLLVLMKKDPKAAEKLSDHFSGVYRYMLGKKNRELVPISEEFEVLQELTRLFAYFPYRKISLKRVGDLSTWVVPGSILNIVERIIRSTIVSAEVQLDLAIYEDKESFSLRYIPEETLRGKFDQQALADIEKSYKFYSDRAVRVFFENPYKIVEIPKLSIDASSHS
ncbi:histidine kinase [Maribacter algicola]|uniref:Histidine kinase n=1 Tax=Meishania litoralis TaxID=3434685 RepID=A0ACC7LLG1_9FLAO